MKSRIPQLATAVVMSLVLGACADQPTQPPAPPEPSITVSDADHALARSLPKLTPIQACNAFVDLVSRIGGITAGDVAVLRAACQQFAGGTIRPTVAQVCAFLLRPSMQGGLPIGPLRTKVERICMALSVPRPPHDDDDDGDDDDGDDKDG